MEIDQDSSSDNSRDEELESFLKGFEDPLDLSPAAERQRKRKFDTVPSVTFNEVWISQNMKIPRTRMESFPEDEVVDFKHVIYNLLVDSYNNPDNRESLVESVVVKEGDQERRGFRFNQNLDLHKKLPILYARHIRKADLEKENQESVFIQDLYKFYLRATLELLGKYFEKRGKYTYLWGTVALFVPGENLKEASLRVKGMKTKTREKKAQNKISKA